jgi:exodeoxyribonuclease V
VLNDEQQVAIGAIRNWLADDMAEPFFVFSGSAGTGKTFSVQDLIKDKSLGRVCFTAPTNKATKVLRDTLTTATYKPECCTIYSLLGLRLEASGEIRVLSQRDPDDEDLDLSCYNLIVVDEGSMISEKLRSHIKDAAEQYSCRFLFMGDPAQLPPVGEQRSPIWRIKSGAHLTKVMRYDNQILTLATRLRDVVDHPAPSLTLASDNSDGQGVWKLPATEFQQLICEAANAGAFQKVNHTKLIAWRNVTVDRYNKLIRATMFGEGATTWLPEDRLILTGPAKDLEDHKIGNTDDEGTVERVGQGYHPAYGDIKIWNLTVAIDGGRIVSLRALHPDGQARYDAKVAELAELARGNSRLWRNFWFYKEAFHGVRHAYAITAHRSQGSTYDTVFVDYKDVLLNKNRQEAFRCLYVACTRAKSKLYLS